MKSKLRLSLSLFSCAAALVLGLSGLVASQAQAQAPQKVDPEHLVQHWILLNRKIDVDVPGSGRNLERPGCAAVSYVVGSDGVPRDLAVRKIVPASDLGSAALSAVHQFRYGPSLSNRQETPVATYYVVAFNAPDDPEQRQRLLASCRLPSYAP